jgi:hypothetical protein
MPKADLKTVTCVCADCVDAQRAERVLDLCKNHCEFAEVKLFTSCPSGHAHAVKIDPLVTLYAYSAFCLKRLHELVDTPHMLVVQHDGWVINGDAWNPDWLQYDYVGPLWIHDHVIDPLSVGSGGFSLRSRRLMRFVSEHTPAWDGRDGDMHWGHEDGTICHKLRAVLHVAGFKFAPPSVAAQFAQGGNCDPAYYCERPFGFHGMWPNINQETGFVGPWQKR